eukprot:CAMPEP_0170258380 /NCGR_PEP_ID=MMETSP0116_2-20130129/29055_1 /TAXON_ID=400756 /ORGANISM="Durinskia baltica, Strain CSIRO CS-38" /LENGTH=112 /DNA_ID=CAMNT_0010509413 /DNA_START=162 /DNA_END=500 /DNA_ORIENTATION=-
MITSAARSKWHTSSPMSSSSSRRPARVVSTPWPEATTSMSALLASAEACLQNAVSSFNASKSSSSSLARSLRQLLAEVLVLASLFHRALLLPAFMLGSTPSSTASSSSRPAT